MCGIAGFAGFTEAGLLQRMCDAIAHRGPDGEGFAELPQAQIAVGMRRLAIIDLQTGDQPFITPDRRVFLVFNGEIYNYRELREQLHARGHSFRTRSDTEVVLASYLEWGHDAWSHMHGMFAIAIADLREPTPRLIVVRDRVGMKPVYYCEANGALLFASEIKALLAWGGLTPRVDAAAIRQYLRLRYVPGPGCLLEGIRKLPPGSFLTFADHRCSIERWWTPPQPAVVDPAMDAAEASRVLGDALRLAVKRHLVADVPLGAFLSGGIDSNTIVGLMAEFTAGRVKTFSIGFPDFPDEDRRRAAITATAFQTDHQAIECRESDMAALPEIAWSLDEPVGDAIVVPMYVLAREARRKVKVVLSGEGADEVLGGYMFHRKLVELDRLRQRLPRWIWPLAADLVRRLPAGLLDRLFDYPGALGSAGRQKVARFLVDVGRTGLSEQYLSSISLFDPEDLAGSLARQLPDPESEHDAAAASEGTALQRLVLAQFAHWLPDDILMKADKMSMAHSLEARVPFMDEEVIQAAARIPDRHKLGPKANKKALRDFARTFLPAEVVNSPKQAFYIPLESYVNAPVMQDLMGHTLNPERVRARGLFNPEWIKATLDSSGDTGFLPLKRLFSIMMLELWFERFCPDVSWA